LIKAVEIAHSGNGRHIEAAADLGCRNNLSEFLDDLCNQSAGYTVIAWKERILFKESFAADAAIPPLTKMQEGISGERDILDDLHTVIVDTVSSGTTGWADVLSARKFHMDMKLICNILYICDNYIFQIKKFCGIIFLEHRDLLGIDWWYFHFKVLFSMLNYYFYDNGVRLIA